MARSPQGLASPRVEDSALQQWIDAVGQRIGGLAGEIGGIATTVGGVQEAVAAGQAETGVAACLLAPQAHGLEGYGGIGVAFITWANPFRTCSNFASATIYRNTADDYITSAMVGQSEWISFLDESVTDGTTYYYWVTWTLTNGSVGPPSDSVMVRTGFDPDRFHDELLDEVRADPLTQALLSDIELPEAITWEIRRLAAQRSLILADLTNIINLTQVDLSAVQAAQQLEINALEATLSGTQLGPPQNRFVGVLLDTRVAAEEARDAYQAINPMVEFNGTTLEWLAHYDADDDINIILQYTSVFQYQRRVMGDWLDNGVEQALASAVTTLAADVATLQGEVSVFAASIIQLQADIAGKADASAVTALTTRVTTTETSTTANSGLIVQLDAAVQGKAEASAVTNLTARVVVNEGSITSQSTQIVSLLAQAMGFAAATAVAALVARVTVNEGEISAISASVTTLIAEIMDVASAGAVTALTARVTTTEGQITVLGSAITQLTADIMDRATATAVTDLSARVTVNEGGITSLSTSVTDLIAQAMGFAAATAVTELAARVTVNEGGITSIGQSITQLMADIMDRATAAAVTELAARVTVNEGGITSLSTSVTDLIAQAMGFAAATAVTELAARVTVNEGGITSIGQSITQLMADIMDRATAAAVTELAARVTVNEGGITSISSSVTTLMAEIMDRATVAAQQLLEARVDLVENVDGTTELAKLARWLVKLQVDDLVGGIGLYNDGDSVRLMVAADRFAVLPPDFLDDSDARIPFAVEGGQVYIDDAVIRDASIGTAKIRNGFLTNLAAVHGTIQFARITKGDIFDLTINNIIQSVNYVPGVAGWAILRDGTFDLNAGAFRGEIRSTNYAERVSGWRIASDGSAEFADISNSEVLWRNAAGFHVTGGNTISAFALGSDIRSYSYITGVAEIESETMAPFAFPSSRLVTGQGNAMPSGTRNVSVVAGSIGRTTGVFSIWASSSGNTLYMQPADTDEDARFFEIVGIRNPRGFDTPPSTVTTADDDGDPPQEPGTPSTPSVDTRGQASLELSTTSGGGGAATSYRWRYSTNSTVTDSDPMVTSTGPSVTISSLDEDTNYWIDVRAENSEGNSAYSGDLATSTIEAQAQAPGTPSTPTLSLRTSTSLTLATTAGSGGTPTTYRWRISTNSTVSDGDPMHTSSSPSITITGLDEDTDYWIDVRGENSEGESSYSGDLAASTSVGAAIEVDKTTLTVDEGGTGTFRVRLTAQPSTSTNVTISETALDLSTLPTIITFTPSNWDVWRTVTVTAAQDSDVQDDTIILTLDDSFGDMLDSVTITITIADDDEELPGTPSTPTLSSRTTTSLTLATVAGSGGTPTTYRWRISTNSTVSDGDPMHTSSSPSITITGLDEDTDYWIDVRGENSEGESSYSGDLAASTSVGAAIEVDKTTLTVDEGGTGTFRVRLTAQPSTSTNVTISETALDLSTLPTIITFTPSNWDVWRTVTVTAAQDSDVQDDTIILTLDDSFGDMLDSVTITITIADDDEELPGTPSTPTLSSRTTTSLTLATVAGSGGTPTTYRWRISTNDLVTDNDPMHTSSSPSITITGLNEDDDYWIDVRGENSEGDSAYSGDLATSTLAGTPDTTVTANAGSDVSVESGGSVQIGGTDTITNGVGTTTYLWSRQSGTGGSLSSTTAQQPTFNAPTVTSDRDIVWRKTTTNNGVSDTDDVTVTVTAPVVPDVTFSISGTGTPNQFSGTGTSANGFNFTDISGSIPAGAFDDNTAHGVQFISCNGSTYILSSSRNRCNVHISGDAELTSDVEGRLRVRVQYGSMSATLSFIDTTEPYLSNTSSALGALVDQWIADGSSGSVTVTVSAS